VRRGFVWSTLGTGGQSLFRLLTLAALARMLEPADFGVVGAGLAVVQFAAVLARFGLGEAIVQRRDLQEDHVRAGFWLASGFGLLGAVALSAAAGIVAERLHMAPLVELVPVLSSILLIQGVSTVAEYGLVRDLAFRPLTLIDLAATLVGYGVVGIGLAMAGAGVWSLAWAEVALVLVRSVLSIALWRHPVRLWRGNGGRDLLRFGAGIILGRLGMFAAQRSDVLVVGGLLDARAAGVYLTANRLTTFPVRQLGAVFDKALSGPLARVQDDPDRVRSGFRRGTLLLALLSWPPTAILLLLAPELVRLVLGAAWGDVTLPLQILLVALPMRMSLKFVGIVSLSLGAVYDRAWRHWLFAGLVVAGAWWGSGWGIHGAAVGIVAATAAHFGFATQLTLRLVGMSGSAWAALHRPVLLDTLLVGAPVWACVALLRGLAWPAWGIVAAGSGAALVSALVCLAVLPAERVLGAEAAPWVGDAGRWLRGWFRSQR